MCGSSGDQTQHLKHIEKNEITSICCLPACYPAFLKAKYCKVAHLTFDIQFLLFMSRQQQWSGRGNEKWVRENKELYFCLFSDPRLLCGEVECRSWSDGRHTW